MTINFNCSNCFFFFFLFDRSQSWRTGFQSLALVAFINFFIGVLYRPASLYHPQRRAILHLKSLQKKTRHNHHRESAATIAAINATNNIINNFNNNKIQKNGSHNNNGHPQVTNGPSHVNHANGGPGSHTNSVHGQSSHGKSVYFDFTILKSKTIRILLSGTCISSFGLWAPIFLLVSLLIYQLINPLICKWGFKWGRKRHDYISNLHQNLLRTCSKT